jgi:hypothetical protein
MCPDFCDSDASCEEGLTCVDGACTEGFCVTDADCIPGQYCYQSGCRRACLTGADCLPGSRCFRTSHACSAPEPVLRTTVATRLLEIPPDAYPKNRPPRLRREAYDITTLATPDGGDLDLVHDQDFHVHVTYLDPDGLRLHRQILGEPGELETIDLPGPGLEWADVAGSGPGRALVYSGRYPLDVTRSSSTAAWWAIGEKAPHRLTPSDAIGVAPPSLFSTAAGQWTLALAPDADQQTLDGLELFQLPATALAPPARALLQPDVRLREVATWTASGRSNLAVSVSRQEGAPGADVLPFLIDGPVVTAWPHGAHRVVVPGASEATGVPQVVGLAPGVLGVSYCQPSAEGPRRHLLPTSLTGEVLGAAVDLGLQRRTGPDDVGSVDCPRATVVRHGDRVIFSSLDAQGATLKTLTCTAR